MFRPTDDDARVARAEAARMRPWRRGPLSYVHRACREGYEVKDPATGTRVTADTLPAGAGALRDALHARRVTFG